MLTLKSWEKNHFGNQSSINRWGLLSFITMVSEDKGAKLFFTKDQTFFVTKGQTFFLQRAKLFFSKGKTFCYKVAKLFITKGPNFLLLRGKTFLLELQIEVWCISNLPFSSSKNLQWVACLHNSRKICNAQHSQCAGWTIFYILFFFAELYLLWVQYPWIFGEVR